MLGVDKIKKILTSKSKSVEVHEGQKYESSLRIYTEPLEKRELEKETAWSDLMSCKNSRIHKDKRSTTDTFFSFPLPVVKESADALRELYRVFNARNPNFSSNYQTDRAKTLGTELMKRLDVRHYVEHTGKQVLKNKPNTFVVIDKDEQGQTYLLTIDNDRLIDVGFCGDSHNEVDYIAFHHHTEIVDDKKVKYLAYYDAEAYRVYTLTHNGEFTEVVNSPHNLGKCPARPFLSELRVSTNKFDRFSPFNEIRALLADFTLFECFVLYAEYYLSFPLVEMAKQTCENVDCEDGYIITNQVLDDGTVYESKKRCESCSNPSMLLGPGTTLEIDPATFKDEVDSSGYLRYVSPPTDNITYQDSKQTSRKLQIKEAVTGINDLMSNQAVNIEQVRAVMESAKKPLEFIARQLDILTTWIVEAAHKLEYDIDMSFYANWGTEWYLLTEEQIQQLYEKSKEIGLEAETREIYNLLLETKYKGNPDQLRAKFIEMNVNPAPFSSLEECYMKNEKGAMNRTALTIKANFNQYLLRFERENASLAEFGKNAIGENTKTLQQIISEIYKTLETYANADNEGEPVTDTRSNEPNPESEPNQS